MISPLFLRRLIAASWLAFVLPGTAQVLITEFLASNHRGLLDEDGDSSDWIELHNAALETVDLDGYHLTDSPLELRKWTFPAKLLSPGAYLVVFASAKDRLTGRLHTNFSLAAGGGFLALTDPQGVILSAFDPNYPPQTQDISYGLQQPFPGAPYTYFNPPTPGQPNPSPGSLLAPPTIQPASRTFLTTQEVTLTPGQSDTEIRYTLNGTVPGADAALSTGPLNFSMTTRLRARAFLDGQPVSPVVGESYLQVAADVADMTSNLPMMIVDNFQGSRPTYGTLAEWMIFEPGGPTNRSSLVAAPTLTSHCFIKVRGSSTANDAKFSLALEARNQLEQDRKVSPLGLPGDSDWVLNALYYYDRTLFHNALAYDLDRAISGRGVRERLVEVYMSINGGPVSATDYYGVYTFCEKITRSPDRVAVEKLRPNDNTLPNLSGGYLFKIDRPDPGDLGLPLAGGQMYDLVDPKEVEISTVQKQWLSGYLNGWWSALNAVDFRDPVNGYASYLDLPTAVDHHVLNVALKNVDGLRASTYLSKSRYGKITFGPAWDFDRSLESLDERDDHWNTWRGETGDLGSDYFRQGVWSQLFKDRRFWQRWVDRYAELRQGVLSSTQITQRINDLASSLSEAQQRNFAKWTAVPPRVSWDWEVQHCRDWLLNRLAWIDTQFTRPATSNAPSVAAGVVPAGFQLTLSSPSLVRSGVKIYYTTDGSDPRFTTYHPEAIQVLVAANAPAKGIVPTQDLGTAWRGSAAIPDPYEDAAWITGTNGIGYDDTPDYDPYIGINFEPPNPPMKSINTTAYLRIKFQLTAAQLASLQCLELHVHYDDGFAAFVNGLQVASENVPPTGLAWNAASLTGHPDSEAMQWSTYDISPALAELHVGENVLALHGLNTPVNSTDFLVQAELIGGSILPEISPQAIEYTGPITIAGTAWLNIRVFDPAPVLLPYPYLPPGSGQTPTGTPWSAPLRLFLTQETPPLTPINLIISELMYHPAAPSFAEQGQGWLSGEDFQYLVLRNVGTTSLNLSGITFTRGITFTAPSAPIAILPAGGSIAIVKNCGAFLARYGNGLAILGEFTGLLERAGEPVTLRDASGGVLQDFTFGNAAPWPPEPDGRGYALVVARPWDHPPLGNPSTWRHSLDPTGETVRTGALPVSQWQQLYFGDDAAAAALSADPDQDGMNNLIEYALGTPPNETSELPLRVCLQSGTLCVEFDYRKGLDSMAITAAGSDSLSGWQNLGPPTAPPQSNPQGTETMHFEPPMTSGRKFYRLTIQQP